jgi:LPXTG-motif cell wall-anchored protein
LFAAALLPVLGAYGLTYGTFWVFAAPGGGDVLQQACKWDCHWYASILFEGYARDPNVAGQPGAANYAFWPLFPLLVDGVRRMPGLFFDEAAFLVNLAANMVFALVFLANDRLFTADRGQAHLILAAFMLSPTTLYLVVPYTEAVFNVLLLVSVVLWRRERPLGAVPGGLALTATRATGVLLPVVWAVGTLAQQRFSLARCAAHAWSRVLALAAMPLGFVAFTMFLYAHTGDPLAFAAAQAGWDRSLGNPAAVLWDGLTGDTTHRIGALAGLGGLAVLAVGLWRRRQDRDVFAYFGVILVPPLVTGVVSLMRYAFAVFIPYLLLDALPRRWLIGVITVFVALRIWVATLWIRGADFLI